MAFRELEVVRVVAVVPRERVGQRPGTSHYPEPGDTGTVVMAYSPPHPVEPTYAVECVEPSGYTRWLADLLESELESVQAGGEGAA